MGVGNAGGTGGTPSAAGGSITALNQSITASDDGGGNAENLTGLIEVNAGIQPGDSGGSLVNADGQVIGMDTAASADSGYQVSATQAYAIPINTALSVAHKIIDGQASSTIHIGDTASSGWASGPRRRATRAAWATDSATAGTAATAPRRPVPSCPRSCQARWPARPAWWPATPSSASTERPSTRPPTCHNLLESRHPGDTVQLQWTDQSGQTHSASVKLASGPPA